MLTRNFDPDIQNIILGVVGNILTKFVYFAGNKGKEIFSSSPEKPSTLERILRQAIDEVFENIDWQGPGRLEEICLF